jgi:hypothetical protein
MSQRHHKRNRLSRRIFLKGLSLAQRRYGRRAAAGFDVQLHRHAFAAETTRKAAAVDPRFVLWFNGNGIPERYWIPNRVGTTTISRLA